MQIIPACDPVPGSKDSCAPEHLIELLVNIFNFMLGLAALVAMLFIVVGGIKMIIWQFTGEGEGGLENAKKTLTQAITGLVIVMLAYLIVNTLLTWLGVDKTSEVGQLLLRYGLLQE